MVANESVRRGVLSAALAASSVLCAASAHATPSMRLVYQRGATAEHCPDEAALRGAVEQRLGYDPFFPWADRTIVASVSAEGRTLRGVVTLLDKDGVVRGTRELAAPPAQCAELVSGMALAISIAVDPSSVDRARKPDDAQGEPADDTGVEWAAAQTVAPPPSDVGPLPVARDDDVTRRPSAPSRTPEVSAGFALASGLSPGLAVGPFIGVMVRIGVWSAGLEGRYLLAPSRRFGSADVTSSVTEGTLIGCVHLGMPFACAFGTASRLGVAGNSLDHPREDAALTARVGPRVGLDVPVLARLSVRAQAEMAVNLGKQSVQIDAASAWVSPRVGGIVGIAALGRFP